MALLLSALSLKHPDEADGCWRIPGDRGTQWLLHAVGMLAKMVCELTVCDDSTAVDGGEGVMRGCLGPKHKRRKETGAVQAGQNGHGWMSEKEGTGEEGRARVDWEGKREHGSRKNNGQGEGFEQDGVSWRHEGSVEHASFPLPLPLMPGVLVPDPNDLLWWPTEARNEPSGYGLVIQLRRRVRGY
ncbi:hypothetical protein CLOP_g15756 [Closterium sp. NIES-67]|nr:hypothetical protein CLOP_g15756 [Closterium sp. NIES-67]